MKRFKYGRTYHLPFSKGVQSDDKLFKDLSVFEGKEVQLSIKMDGENSTLYSDYVSHARSLDSKSNWTRDLLKKTHFEIAHNIPEGYRLCCENLFAKHSIFYPDDFLEGYLYLLSVWDERNVALSLDETIKMSKILGLPMPKQIYRGVFDIKLFEKIANEMDLSIHEGYVMRLTSPIKYEDFSRSVAKFVREGHVQEDAEHWLKTAVKNGKPQG